MNNKPFDGVPELHPVPVHSPWHHVGIDFIGPIHPTGRSGNRFILTLSDYFTNGRSHTSTIKACSRSSKITTSGIHCLEPNA